MAGDSVVPLRPYTKRSIDGRRRTCNRPNCAKPAVKRGMCDTDYQRWRVATPLEERRRPGPEERFQGKVMRGEADECWPWTEGTGDHGYGVFFVRPGVKVGAHRYAYWLANGMEADQVDHTCHNGSGCPGGSTCPHRRCCNPAHLEDTTNLVNSLRGESPAAKHARKTHCVNGHEFTTENTYNYVWGRTNRPRRICRQCTRNREAAKAISQRKSA